MEPPRIKAAILGTGNIGTDLLFKILKNPGNLELSLFAGIDPESKGLKRAMEMGIPTSHSGVDALIEASDLDIVFDATSARAHRAHAPRLEESGKYIIDMTPAAIGPYVVPNVNLDQNSGVRNVNLITCGGQATIPIVNAVSRIVPVDYAEIVSTVSSASAGPGTRQNIDEFTFTTARGLEEVGGARSAKAIIILNPAEPPILMRNTIYILPSDSFEEERIVESIAYTVNEVQQYVPGYRMKGDPVFDEVEIEGVKKPLITVLLEVAGAGDFFPEYAGNLDIMTASAWRVGQQIATQILNQQQRG